MTKISLDTEQGEIQVTRSIGKNGDGSITINREGGASIEINLGVGSIGLTSDYGGAISLGVGGQEVTWGREGGTIHIGIGGFEVDVEARDCIVTEIKSIFGQIVAQRSYPDPGCKLPDPPTPTPTPTPTPGPGSGGIDLPDTDEVGWVIFNMRRDFYTHRTLVYVATLARAVSGVQEENRRPDILPFKVVSTQEPAPQIIYPDYTYEKGTRVHYVQVYGTVGEFGTAYINAAQLYPPNTYNFWHVAAFYGSVGNIKRFIALAERNNEYDIQRRLREGSNWGSGTYNYYTPTAFVPLKVIPEIPKPFLPTGNKPPMKNCCEEVLDYLADFEEAFDIKRLLKDKFPVSNTFMAPECDPASATQAKSYYEIMQCVFRMMAHGMIFEPKVKIKDADAAKAGDQEFKARYLNATGWASAVSEALMEVKDDGNVATNMDIRSSFAVTQLMVGVADAIYKLDTILDCFGIELAHETQTLETPYNLMIQIGKGFGKNNERQIDLNQDEATEALLPQLLQTKKNKIKTVVIHPRSRTVHEILENIEANIARISNG